MEFEIKKITKKNVKKQKGETVETFTYQLEETGANTKMTLTSTDSLNYNLGDMLSVDEKEIQTKLLKEDE